MENLVRFSLSHSGKNEDWELRNDSTDRVVKRFETKAEATAGGVLADAIGNADGSVRIHKENGRIQEERTFPRSKDPRKSPG